MLQSKLLQQLSSVGKRGSGLKGERGNRAEYNNINSTHDLEGLFVST